VGDLDLIVEVLDPATDDTRRPERQLAREVVGLGVKEDEVKETGVIAAAHSVGTFAMARQMAVDLDGERCNCACRCFPHLGGETAVDDPGGQMPEQIDDRRSGEPFEKPSQTRTDARKRDHRRIKRKQNLGTQAFAPLDRTWCRQHAGNSVPVKLGLGPASREPRCRHR
jgi:hypothetical protein